MNSSDRWLLTTCQQVRQFLEPLWIEKHLTWDEPVPEIASTYMCRYTSLFLKEVLIREKSINPVIKVGRPLKMEDEGTPQGKYGFLASDRCWYDHCWLEMNGLIIDLTADQFGDRPIIMTSTPDSRYRANLEAHDLASDLKKLSRTSDRWLQIWFKEQLNN